MKIHTLMLLLACAINLHGQSMIDGTSFLNRTAFKIGYYGDIQFEHGLNLGAEYLWKEKLKVKEKRKRAKTITHQFLINGSIGYATNFSNKTDNGLHTYYGLIWRRTNPKRWQFNLEVNPLGYYRSFLPETFEVKEDKVSKVKLPGRSYYAPSIGVGIGRQRTGKRRSGWYLNLNYTLRTPYNAGVLGGYSIQYGHRFNFKKK
ncbi:hypothetical protein [Aurantibacter sp.]|uniref:hypothetical protein n=1 Tax=Aurantibacter sp. TaxID=2807103 RepID=UPI003266C497